MPWSYEYTHTHVRTYLRTYSIRHRFRMGEFLGIIRSEKWKMCAFFLSRVRRKRENCQLTRPRWNGRRNETMTGQESNPLAFGNWEAWVDDWQLLAFVVRFSRVKIKGSKEGADWNQEGVFSYHSYVTQSLKRIVAISKNLKVNLQKVRWSWWSWFSWFYDFF